MKKILVLISNYSTNQKDYCQNLIQGLCNIKNYNFKILVFSSVRNNFLGDYEEIIIENYKNNDFCYGIYDYLINNQNYINDNFDYILLTENDLLFKEENFNTFFEHEKNINNDEFSIGFLRYEIKDNQMFLIDLHYNYCVDFNTNQGIIDYIDNNSYFSLVNPHQGCFMLKTNIFYKKYKEIHIGNSLEDKVSKVYYAKNNIGSSNGIKKYIPKKDIFNLLVHHQPNKYVNIFTKITNLKDLLQ